MLNKTSTKTWFSKKNDAQQRINFIFYVIFAWDFFVTHTVKAGDNYKNHASVLATSPADVNLDLYEIATKAIADDYKNIKQLIARNKPCEEQTPLTPILDAAPPPAQRPRLMNGPEKPGPAPHRPLAAAQGGGSPAENAPNWGVPAWGSGFGGAGGDWQKTRDTDRVKSKAIGDLVCAEGFHQSIEPDLEKKYCGRF